MPGYSEPWLSDLYLLHDALATWLSDNTPYFASSPAPEPYEGLPLSEVNVGSHELEIPGAVIRKLTPQAARVLCVATRDHVEAAYLPPQYVRDAPGAEPWAVSPSACLTLYDRTGRIHFAYHNALTDETLTWANTRRNISRRLGQVEMAACLEIAQHLPAYHDEMQQRGVLPEDLLAHRQQQSRESRPSN